MVLCLDETAHYKNAFKSFAENEMIYEVIWVNKTNWTQSGTYFLLCDVCTRIPEDVRYVINSLNLDGKKTFFFYKN